MNVAVIGLGIMGAAVAEKLLESGHTVRVYNRSRQKVQALIDSGAIEAPSPAEAAAQSAIVFTLVTDSEPVKDLTLGPRGILTGLDPDSVHCDMSTVIPSGAEEVAQAYRREGKRFVQAPVLGSKKQAASGELLIFAGGGEQDIRRCEPALRVLSKRIWCFPAHGQSAAVKLACNMMIAQMMAALSQSMAFTRKSGVSAQTLLEILEESSLQSPMYERKGRSILRGDFTPNFTVSNLIKDLTLADMAGREAGVSLLMNAMVRQLFVAAERAGYGELDYSAVFKALDEGHS